MINRFVDVARDFSPVLGGNLKSNGNNSSEEFFERILEPICKQLIHSKLYISFKGVLGLPHTFFGDMCYRLQQVIHLDRIVIVIDFDQDFCKQFFKNVTDTVYLHDGFPVPRVSEIISSCGDTSYLCNWANNLGKKGTDYTEELNRLAGIGTCAHDLINKFITTGVVEDANNIPFNGFLDWWRDVNEGNKVEILGSEQVVTCKLFGGTYDLLLKINGENYLCDFKTSNYIQNKHFLQLSAYDIALRPIPIHGYIIIQLDKFKPRYKEYTLLRTIREHDTFMQTCRDTFMSMVESHRRYSNQQQMFKTIQFA